MTKEGDYSGVYQIRAYIAFADSDKNQRHNWENLETFGVDSYQEFDLKICQQIGWLDQSD